MSVVNELPELIASLTLREKTEFRTLLLGKNFKNTSLHSIFDSLVQNQELKPEKKDENKHYKSKSELKDLLITTLLNNYEQHENFEKELHKRLRLAKYLINRDQFDYARNILTAVKLKAAEYDLHPIVFECLNIEKSLLRRFINNSFLDELNHNIADLNQLLQTITTQTQIINCHDQYVLHNTSDLIASLPSVETNPEQYTSTSRRFYYAIKATVAEKEKNTTLQRDYRKLIVDLLEEKPLWKSIHPNTYITAMANYANALYNLGDYDGIDSVVQNIYKFKPATELLEASSFQLARYLQLLALMGRSQYSQASALQQQTEKELDKYNGKLNKTYELAININLALSLWINQEPLKAIKWVKKIISLRNCEARLDIQRFAYLLWAMLLADIQNELELSKLEILVVKDRVPIPISDFQTKSIELIVKWAFANENQKAKLLAEILTQIESPVHPKQLGKDELNIWVQNKLTQTPLIELAQ